MHTSVGTIISSRRSAATTRTMARSRTYRGWSYTSLTIRTTRSVPWGIRLETPRTKDMDAPINEGGPLHLSHRTFARLGAIVPDTDIS